MEAETTALAEQHRTHQTAHPGWSFPARVWSAPALLDLEEDATTCPGMSIIQGYMMSSPDGKFTCSMITNVLKDSCSSGCTPTTKVKQQAPLRPPFVSCPPPRSWIRAPCEKCDRRPCPALIVYSLCPMIVLGVPVLGDPCLPCRA